MCALRIGCRLLELLACLSIMCFQVLLVGIKEDREAREPS